MKVSVQRPDLRAITQIDASISKLAATKVTKSVGSSQSKYIENFPTRPTELTSTKLANNAAPPFQGGLARKTPRAHLQAESLVIEKVALYLYLGSVQGEKRKSFAVIHRFGALKLF